MVQADVGCVCGVRRGFLHPHLRVAAPGAWVCVCVGVGVGVGFWGSRILQYQGMNSIKE